MTTKTARDIAHAFRERRAIVRNNTVCTGDGVYLFKSMIAKRDDDGMIHLTLAGYDTVTTRDRLNAICAAFGIPERFSRRAGAVFFGERSIDTLERVPLCGPLGMLALAHALQRPTTPAHALRRLAKRARAHKPVTQGIVT